MLTLDQVLQKVGEYNPKANFDLIRKAYEFSSKAHEGQLRKSGQPFVVHPLEVAIILAEMKLDTASVAAGMLHDTLEDTATTSQDIEREFGKEILELVDGVTKISKLHFNTRAEQQSENFRKMIMAMSKDIRVVLIKLADRLNNLNTLQFMPEEKQMRIAQETLDIYAPLANRLGIQWMKVQLEDLSFKFVKPEIYKQIEKKVSHIQQTREEYIHRVENTIKNHFRDSISNFEIKGRLKHIYSVYQKMERQNVTFDQIHDLMAFRILVRTLEECYEALGLIHSLWKPVPGRFKDYIAMSKANNYQSVHTTVICLEGQRVEFQIRTFEMHEVAENGIAAHWRYKEDGKIDMESEQTFQWLRQLVDWHKELKDSLEFMDTIRMDLFSSEIYVFTPKGDVRALPFGATPIDFAYSIHSDVGSHCSGAKVNGRIVPLNTKLESGDEVEIITMANRTPTKDWLKMTATSRAKAKIREHLKQEQREKSLVMGKNIFEEGCAKFDLEQQVVLQHKEFKDYIKKKGMGNEQGFYSALAYGKISMPLVIKHLFPDLKPEASKEASILKKIFQKVSKQNKNWVLINGLDEILVMFAKCCSPIQGDAIVGFITRGRGVMIHREECHKVPNIDPERRVNATWNKTIDTPRTAKLRIVSESKTGMLASIAQTISDRKINITKALVHTTKDEKALLSIDVGVKNVTELNQVMKSVGKIKGVISVEREM